MIAMLMTFAATPPAVIATGTRQLYGTPSGQLHFAILILCGYPCVDGGFHDWRSALASAS